MAKIKVKTGQKIVLIGDSITDAGRRTQFAPIGNGYVSIAASLATAKYPERSITWVNKGIGGDTVEGLEQRWTNDVIQEKPDYLSIAIGINNAVRARENPNDLKEILASFEASYRAILNRTKEETKANIIILNAFYIPNEDRLQRRFDVEPFNGIIHRLAKEYKVTEIDIDLAFKKAISKDPGRQWTITDGVHPNQAGHTLIALELLRALGWQEMPVK